MSLTSLFIVNVYKPWQLSEIRVFICAKYLVSLFKVCPIMKTENGFIIAYYFFLHFQKKKKYFFSLHANPLARSPGKEKYQKEFV